VVYQASHGFAHRPSRSLEQGQAIMNDTPKYATVPTWCEISGMGRTLTYAAIGRGDIKAVKLNSRTLVDVQSGLDWLRSLPPAEIKPQHSIAA